MLARGLRRLLAFELLLWVLLWLIGCRLAAYSGAWSLVGVPLSVLLLRALLVALSFWLAHRRGARPPPSLRISWWRGLRLIWKEWVAASVLSLVLLPLEHRWMRRDRLLPEINVRDPLLLVHGYACNRGVWWALRRAVGRVGWRVATLNLEPPLATLDTLAAQLASRIAAVLRETGAERVILIGHGVGGLVCRAYLARYGEEAARALITLGTPHQGTRLAAYGAGPLARELEPGSAALAALPHRLPIPCVAIYSTHDNFVMPQGPCELSGARNMPLAGIGHLHMLFSQRVVRVLLRELSGV